MYVLKKIIKSVDRSAAVRAVACALVLMLTCSICGFDSKCGAIRENVLRLHILANSDSEEDQALKLRVRDALLTVSETVFADCKDEQQAAAAAAENIELFTAVAQAQVYENGYSYPVRVELADTWFETRDYERFTLPAGNYEALRVIIGEGEGHNWWCVMFPAVCLPVASGEAEDFSEVLKDDEADIVQKPERYKARFKIVEVFEKTRSKLARWFN